MGATKPPLTFWFLAFYLIGQTKTGISSLELSRHLGVADNSAWLLHNTILRAMTEREQTSILREKSSSMTPTSAEKQAMLPRLVEDRRIRCQSLPPSP